MHRLTKKTTTSFKKRGVAALRRVAKQPVINVRRVFWSQNSFYKTWIISDIEARRGCNQNIFFFFNKKKYLLLKKSCVFCNYFNSFVFLKKCLLRRASLSNFGSGHIHQIMWRSLPKNKCFFFASTITNPVASLSGGQTLKKTKNFFFYSRPLLNLTRYEIKHICQVFNLPILPDKTNQFVFYTRNRLRKQLLPLLRIFFNPKIEKHLFQFAELSVTEQIAINYITNKIVENYKNCFSVLTPKNKTVSLSEASKLINCLPLMSQRIVFKKLLLKIKICNSNFSIIEKFLFYLNNKTVRATSKLFGFAALGTTPLVFTKAKKTQARHFMTEGIKNKKCHLSLKNVGSEKTFLKKLVFLEYNLNKKASKPFFFLPKNGFLNV